MGQPCNGCRYCDKESELQRSGLFAGQWLLNGRGYCMAENSAINGLLFCMEIPDLKQPRECPEFVSDDKRGSTDNQI